MRVVVSAVLLFCLVACAHTKDKLIGTWGLDMAALMDANPEMRAQMKQNPEAKAMFETMVKNMTFTFSETTIQVNMMGKTERATYRVLKEDGNTVHLESIDEGKGPSDAEVIQATFTDDDHMSLTKDGEDLKMTLERRGGAGE